MPNKKPPVILDVVDIFSMLALPHVGHLGASEIGCSVFLSSVRYFIISLSTSASITAITHPIRSKSFLI